MNEHDRDDERLSRLLSMVGADADPALWTRVRARIESRERGRGRTPAWLEWLARPAALAAATAALVATAGLGIVTLRAPAEEDDSVTLTEALLDEGMLAAAPVQDVGAAGDSGGYR